MYGDPGALGGSPDRDGTPGELAIAPARFWVNCPNGHKSAIECQALWQWISRERLYQGKLELNWYWTHKGYLSITTTLAGYDPDRDSLYEPRKCPVCDRNLSFKHVQEVYGFWKVDQKCNAKCLNATGHNCDCSCGGRNHGSKALTWFEALATKRFVKARPIDPPTPTAAERHPATSSTDPPHVGARFESIPSAQGRQGSLFNRRRRA